MYMLRKVLEKEKRNFTLFYVLNVLFMEENK